jgi:hypothetical protein
MVKEATMEAQIPGEDQLCLRGFAGIVQQEACFGVPFTSEKSYVDHTETVLHNSPKSEY